MDTLNFSYIFLGQSVLKYQVPLDVYDIINNIYELIAETNPNKYPPIL